MNAKEDLQKLQGSTLGAPKKFARNFTEIHKELQGSWFGTSCKFVRSFTKMF